MKQVQEKRHQSFDSTITILNSQLKAHTITIEKEYDLSLKEIDSYNGQLNQVFMNVLTNAIHAIGKQTGTISIRTKDIGEQVEIQIADTGSGMSEASKERLFEPFYTTKEVGAGMGLGLSISYGIIKRHNGTIEVESELGKGTVFIIRLPKRQA